MKPFAIVLASLVGVAAPAGAATAPTAWSHCAACHANSKDGAAGLGPNLWGVGGAQAGMRPGFPYSPALKRSKLVWTKATIAKFIANPTGAVPGTAMPNPGVTAPADRDALATYLLTLK